MLLCNDAAAAGFGCSWANIGSRIAVSEREGETDADGPASEGPNRSKPAAASASPSAAAPARQRRPGKPPGHPKPAGSGRQRGTPNRSTREIRAVAQRHGAKAVRELVRLMTKSTNEATRMKAAVELLDRGYGRPITPNVQGNFFPAADQSLADVMREIDGMTRGLPSRHQARQEQQEGPEDAEL